ncbi:L-lysine exporter family protein LysE/ArgO [Chitinivorax tropicus]|uniref:L-lysine exporter family protein LysE/ArgO n=1 Tax=Chitinivorax tropicus TaxID=714531 RepID=A0A840MII3_9PROT|nr:LysE/ArgO family amino acid transporter [Chitinivorax tropicus]MBB5018458.1 L-lysine exporter family protein LysE/ArgO [Chitinivorax tropicus]
MLTTWLQGLLMGASLIMVLGAQNAFVLTQGLRGRHRMSLALTSALCDALLIMIGVAGMGALFAGSPALLAWAAWAGAAFLATYGARSLYSALRPATAGALVAADTESGVIKLILTTLAFSLLNPHVYLDTVVLLGSLGSQHGDTGRWWFGAGAATASFIWFFSLSYGAKLLLPLFQKPSSWRILDCLNGLVMWGIAATLIQKALAL